MKTDRFRFFYKIVIPGIGILFICLFSMGCSQNESVAIFSTSNGPKKVLLELAKTKKEKERGLMFRSGLGEDQGMLFFFDGDTHPSFWMKNTYLSLDILFLSEGGVVKDFLERLPPCALDPCPSYTSRSPARFVLELRAGFVEKHHIRRGDRVKLYLSG